MDFIKRNLFYMILAGAMVIAFVATIVIRGGAAEQTEKKLAEDAALLQKVEVLLRAPAVNERVIKAEKDRLENIRQTQKDVIEDSINFNCSHFANPDFPGLTGTTVKLFPLDNELLRVEGTIGITRMYREELAKRRDALNPILQLTKDEIEAEARKIDSRPKATGTATPTPTGTAISAESAAQALKNLTATKAANGMIYVDQRSLDWFFPTDERLPRDEWEPKLWMAWINLWTQSDILAAIAETNSQSLQIGTGGLFKAANVSNAAIKRIVGIKVLSNYVMDPSASIGTAGADAGASDAYRMLRGGDMTHRITGRDLEVVRYNLTVVMYSRYLPALENSLQKRNYHTVLKVEVTEPVESASATGGDVVSTYGPDPVVQVTIQGQLVLLSGWTRGTAVREKGAIKHNEKNEIVWVRPPLMPLDVLKMIGASGSVLREEDTERTQQPAGIR